MMEIAEHEPCAKYLDSWKNVNGSFSGSDVSGIPACCVIDDFIAKPTSLLNITKACPGSPIKMSICFEVSDPLLFRVMKSAFAL